LFFIGVVVFWGVGIVFGWFVVLVVMVCDLIVLCYVWGLLVVFVIGW